MIRTIFNTIGLTRGTFSSGFIPIFAILVISILIITPKFNNIFFLMVFWGGFFLLNLFNLNRFNKKLIRLLFLGISFVIICLIYTIFGLSSAKMGYSVLVPLMYFAPVLALLIIDKCHNEQQIRFLFHFIALAVAINIADNIRISYDFGMDNVVFQRLGGMVEEAGNSESNFGGNQFVNMSVFYACIMFMAFLKSKEWIEKIVFGIYVCISTYFIVMCTLKASVVVISLISFAMMYISYKSKENFDKMLFFIVIVGVLGIFFMNDIIYFLIDVIDSDRITERLIIFTIEGDVTDSTSFLSRSNLWLLSIDSWLSSINSFFFGIGNHNQNDFMTIADSGIGNHSDFFDVLGRYGIIGAFILYSSIKVYYDYLKNKFGTYFEFEILSFLIVILIMGITKRIIYPQSAIMFFVLFPLTLSFLSNKEHV